MQSILESGERVEFGIIDSFPLLSVEDAREVSLHPAHLITTANKSLLPAALIPFCSYQNQTTNLSQMSKEIPFPACSRFEPEILNGQLCYSLDVAKHTNLKTRPGEKHGLLLMIDSTGFMSQDVDNKVEIHLNTLGRFRGEGEGRYYLSALKKMTATKNFLELSDQLKGCRNEGYQECHERQYRLAVQQECECLPWRTLAKAPSKGTGEISSTKSDTNRYCLLDKYNCISNVTKERLDCNVSCTGLYTDLFHDTNNIHVVGRSNFLPLEEYKRYRINFVKSIKFDPTKEKLSKILNYH